MTLKSIITALLLSTLVPGALQADEADWTPIFNGKNLDGWAAKFSGHTLGDNILNTFRVEDGVLRVSYEQYEKFGGRFGHLFYKSPYKSYRLKFDYRFLGEQVTGGPGWAFRNNGVMIHAQAPETMGLDQDFPVSIEVQLLGQTGDKARPTGNVCTPGTHIELDGKLEKNHCIGSSSKTYAGDGWVTAEIEVAPDGTVTHYIDGEQVMQYTRTQLDPSDKDAAALMQDGQTALTSGYIALQAESHPTEFRNLEIKSTVKAR